jgi:hypothetical protein
VEILYTQIKEVAVGIVIQRKVGANLALVFSCDETVCKKPSWPITVAIAKNQHQAKDATQFKKTLKARKRRAQSEHQGAM